MRTAALLLVLAAACDPGTIGDDAEGTDPLSAACGHDPCATGAKLTSSCDPCVAQICAKDPYCCKTKWNQQCVNEVASICTQVCGGGVDAGGTGVGSAGGRVPLLHFGLTGDTRGGSCGDTAGYPTGVITSIAQQFEALGLQFALDLGDHMFVCNNSLPTATAQMNLYLGAIRSFAGPFFMTMGNHECTSTPCLAGSTNANYVAFMKALAPVATSPYYSFDVGTSLGVATFVIVADNAWDSSQAAWLEQTLAVADEKAKYTIVARHHPEGDTSIATNAESMQIIRRHKFALFLSGHSHLYRHMTTDNGRDLVLGTGGAPLVAGGAFHGYAVIDQQADGPLKISVFDITNALQDTWSAGPNL